MKKLKTLLQVLSIFIVMLPFQFCKSTDNKGEEVSKPKIAVVIPVTIDAFDQLIAGLKEKIANRFEIQLFSAESDVARFETIIQSALLLKPDYLITIGTQLTNSAFGPKFERSLPIVVAGAISDPYLVNALIKAGIAPPRNSPVAIVSDSPKENIYELFGKAIKSFFPNIKKVGILYNPSEINSKGTTDNITDVLSKNSIHVIKGVINSLEDVEKVTNRLLLDKVDAIIIPHDKYAVTKATSIVKICDKIGIPVLSLDDGTVKKDGVSIGISVNYRDVGSMIAETILKIEDKQAKAENIPVASLANAKIYINAGKVATLGIRLPANLDQLIIKY
jgi:putative tryptophan/tyrosine transport system substrate-binding protein